MSATATCIAWSLELGAVPNSEINSSKKGIIAAIFLIYILNIIGIAAGNLLKEKKPALAKTCEGFSNDLCFRSFFFFIFAILMHNVSPVPSGVIIIFIYIVSVLLLFVAHLKPDKWFLKLAAFGLHTILCLTMAIILLADPWCRFVYGRGIIN